MSVSDTGRGMPVGLLEQIFDPFFTTKEKAKNMGIKAFIMKPLIRKDIAETIRKVLDHEQWSFNSVEIIDRFRPFNAFYNFFTIF